MSKAYQKPMGLYHVFVVTADDKVIFAKPGLSFATNSTGSTIYPPDVLASVPEIGTEESTLKDLGFGYIGKSF